MLITQFEEYELYLLEPRHDAALAKLEPGDLTFSQGEWLGANGREKEYIKEKLAEFAQGKSLYAGIWLKDTLIGLVAFCNMTPNGHSASISYVMSAPFRGKGIMTKACGAFIDYGFGILHLYRITVGSDIANVPSCKVPEKLGFIKEGVSRGRYLSKDGPRDVCEYSMLRKDWCRSNSIERQS